MAKIGDKFASDIAREFIEDHLGKLTEEEIKNTLKRKTNLRINTIDALYKEALAESYQAAKLEMMERLKKSKQEKKGEGYYKGRKRSFFNVDDSKLYKGVV